MASKVLILGTKEDPHVWRVYRKLLEMGGCVSVLDYVESTESTLRVDRYGTRDLEVEGRKINSSWTIWYRVKLAETSPYFLSGDRRVARFRASQWRAFYNLVCSTLEGSTVNRLSELCFFVKPEQQEIAANAGFNVPMTTLSTTKEHFVAHMDAFPESIMKAVGGANIDPVKDKAIPDFGVITTSRVYREDLEEAPEDAFYSCPQMLQEMILKKYELRVVVMGQYMAGFAINSQSRKISEVDWRLGSSVLNFEPVGLSEDIQKKVQTFMRISGLYTGSIDLVVDNQDRTWFVEVNPDGQWAWLDDIVDGQISTGFARELLTHDPLG